MAGDTAQGLPVLGTDATVADTYSETVAAPAGNRQYRHLVAYVESYPVILSLDGGTTDQLYVGVGTLAVDGVQITQAVHAKNATGGSAGTNLRVMVW